MNFDILIMPFKDANYYYYYYYYYYFYFYYKMKNRGTEIQMNHLKGATI